MKYYYVCSIIYNTNITYTNTMSKFDKFEIKTLFEQSQIQEKQDIIIEMMKLIQNSPTFLHISMKSISNDNTLTELCEELANLKTRSCQWWERRPT